MCRRSSMVEWLHRKQQTECSNPPAGSNLALEADFCRSRTRRGRIFTDGRWPFPPGSEFFDIEVRYHSGAPMSAFFKHVEPRDDVGLRSARGATVMMIARAMTAAAQVGCASHFPRSLIPADHGLVAMVTAVAGFTPVHLLGPGENWHTEIRRPFWTVIWSSNAGGAWGFVGLTARCVNCASRSRWTRRSRRGDG